MQFSHRHRYLKSRLRYASSGSSVADFRGLINSLLRRRLTSNVLFLTSFEAIEQISQDQRLFEEHVSHRQEADEYD